MTGVTGSEILRDLESMPTGEGLKEYVRRTMLQIVSDSGFCNAEGLGNDDEANRRASWVRTELASLCSEAEICLTPEIGKEPAETPFHQERILPEVCDRFQILERKDGFWLAAEQSIMGTFSFDNLWRSGLFDDVSPDLRDKSCRKASELIAAYFEAKTGTADMPVTTFIKIRTDGNGEISNELRTLKSQGKIRKTDNYDPRNSTNLKRDETGKISMDGEFKVGSILDQCFDNYRQANKVVKAYHGWTGSRQSMVVGEGFWAAIEAIGEDGVGMVYAGMGAEMHAGWKITERGLISPLDYALQAHVADCLYGAFFDLDLRTMHSMGAHAGFYLREFYDEIIRKRISGGFNDNPRFGFILENPALFESNVFLIGLVGKLIGIACARSGVQGHLSREESILWGNALSLIPRLLADRVEARAVNVLIAHWLLKSAPVELIREHGATFTGDKQTMGAQAAGLADRSQREPFVSMLEGMQKGSPIGIIVSHQDKLVRQKELVELLHYAHGIAEMYFVSAGHYARVSETYAEIVKNFVTKLLISSD